MVWYGKGNVDSGEHGAQNTSTAVRNQEKVRRFNAEPGKWVGNVRRQGGGWLKEYGVFAVRKEGSGWCVLRCYLKIKGKAVCVGAPFLLLPLWRQRQTLVGSQSEGRPRRKQVSRRTLSVLVKWSSLVKRREARSFAYYQSISWYRFDFILRLLTLALLLQILFTS